MGPLLSLFTKSFSSFTKKERFLFWGASALAIVSAIGLAAIIIRTTTEVIPAQGGKYVEGMVGQPTYVNPVLASSHVDKSLVRLLFANVPTIAEKIELEEDGRVVRVRLKENLLWSDGAELTSDDVIFTVEKIQDPETRSPFFSSWQGVVVSRGSQLEVLFRLATPYAFFLENLEDLYVLPKHLFAEVPATNWRLSDYNLQPIGSGPYRFSSYEKRSDGFISGYGFETNQSYAGEKPNIERFDVRFFGDTDQAIRQFNGGQIDGLMIFDSAALDEIQRPLELFEFPSPTTYSVFWNQSQNLALQSKEVRRALELSINRDEIIASALRGYAVSVYGPIPPVLPFVPESLKRASSSKEQAIQLLESNGWKIGDEGIREKSIKGASIKLSIELLTPDVPFLLTTARMLEKMWGEIGVGVQVIVASPGEEVDGLVKNRNYEAVLFGNSVRESGDLFSFWHSSERFYPGLNLALYNNKSADQLIERVRRNFDTSGRQAELESLQEIIVNDAPALFLYSPKYLYAANKNIQGVNPRFLEDAADRFSNVSEWFLKTARVLK